MEIIELFSLFENKLNKLLKMIEGCFSGKKGNEQALKYIKALLSEIERKNSWQIAEAQGEKTPYKTQQFLYRSVWESDGVRDELQDYVQEELGEEEGVYIIDETGFIKKGKKSAGVNRQYSGTAGKIENCQIGVFLTYASSKGFTMVDRQLYLPKEWVSDKVRCAKAGIPIETSFETKPQMALNMMKRAEAKLSFSWVVGDCVYGEAGYIRNWIEDNKKGYVMAVSGKNYVTQRKKQKKVSDIISKLGEDGWIRLCCGEGTKGGRIYEWKVITIDQPSDVSFERCLLIRRSISSPDEIKAFICFYPRGTLLKKIVEIAGIRWTIERSFQESKDEIGLDQYEVRSYSGWYKHITLAMCAHAILAAIKVNTADVQEILPFMPEKSETGSLDAFKKGRNL